MKIIVAEPTTNCNNATAHTLDIIDKSGRITTLADTALLTHGKPVFVPDWGGECTATVCIALRISRLGKSIPQRFAQRYYDAISLALKFEMSGMKAELKKAGMPWNMAENFDGAVECGNFEETTGESPTNIGIIMKCGEKEYSFKTENFGHTANEAIATASLFLSIRQGDIMLLPICGANFTAVPNTHITGFANGSKLLEFNIK